jgi:hypothetical protein
MFLLGKYETPHKLLKLISIIVCKKIISRKGLPGLSY